MANDPTLDSKPANPPLPCLADPAPLGLMGFGMTTVLLNLLNAGLLSAAAWSMVLAMGVFYGGIAQVIAGAMEFRRGNTFGTTAFTSYGLFWMSLAALLVFPKLGWFPAADGASMAAYLALWGLFTAYMFVGTRKKSLALQFVFGSLTLLFFLLALGDLTGIAIVKKAAGLEGIACGLSAVYLAAAEVLRDARGRPVLPIGEP